MKITTLGPEGTYSVQAARVYDLTAELTLKSTVPQIVNEVAEDRAEAGVIPLENSIHGIVAQSLDELAKSELMVVDEVVLDIRHVLCGLQLNIKPGSVKKIYSHPQALNQCANYISRHYPHAELVESASTADAIRVVARRNDENCLAIGSRFAAEHYAMAILDEDIEDEPGNQTRFVVISKTPSVQPLPFTLIAVVPETDRSGLLYDILGIIKAHGINMLQIDSRPVRNQLGSYIFYIRLALSSDDNRYESLAEEAAQLNVSVRKLTS